MFGLHSFFTTLLLAGCIFRVTRADFTISACHYEVDGVEDNPDQNPTAITIPSSKYDCAGVDEGLQTPIQGWNGADQPVPETFKSPNTCGSVVTFKATSEVAWTAYAGESGDQFATCTLLDRTLPLQCPNFIGEQVCYPRLSCKSACN